MNYSISLCFLHLELIEIYLLLQLCGNGSSLIQDAVRPELEIQYRTYAFYVNCFHHIPFQIRQTTSQQDTSVDAFRMQRDRFLRIPHRFSCLYSSKLTLLSFTGVPRFLFVLLSGLLIRTIVRFSVIMILAQPA